MPENDQPLGVPPSEFHPQRPPAPFKKSGTLKAALLMAAFIVILDLFIYFFLIKPDDTSLLKMLEFLKPPTPTVAPKQVINVEPTAIPTLSDDPYATTNNPVTKLAKEDLAKRISIEESEIKVELEAGVTWTDGSLGCPQAGMMYTQALVEGTKVILSHGGKTYNYHAGPNGEPTLCENPSR